MELIASAHPILASLDFAATEAFYARLGFTPTLRAPDYLIVARGDVELHFWACDDRAVAEQTSCYIRTPDVDALYGAFARAGETPLRPPEDRPWGMREFYVWDPNGNLLRFGERRPGLVRPG